MVRSVPTLRNFSEDQMAMLAIARDQSGRVDKELLIRRRVWTGERERAVLSDILRDLLVG